MIRRSLILACGLAVLCTAAAGGGWAQTVDAAAGAPADQPLGRAAAVQTRDDRRPPLERPVSATFANTRLDVAIDRLGAAAKVTIVYTDRVLPAGLLVSDTLVAVPLGRALARVLKGTGVVVRELADGQLVLGKSDTSNRPAGSGTADSVAYLFGRVTAAGTGESLVGAIVSIDGTSLSAVTRDSGYYILPKVPWGDRVVVARFIGYRPTTRMVVVDTGSVRLDLALEQAPARLEELVTTATGPQRRVELGNAITTIRVDSVMETAPIRNVTDLLETRVPGLVAQPTTGAPGDPTRLRLRGVSSVYRSNDPIIIVDGVRIYSDQSDPRSANLAGQQVSFSQASPVLQGESTTPAPSPLDQIDPNSIETIEVFKGPSAATMYGADAANGVIVITTKKGRPGPARWRASIDHGRSVQPGRYPVAYFRWGHDSLGGPPRLCPLTHAQCVQDSLVIFQPLDDPALSVFGRGHRTELSLGVSGGSETLTYAVSGRYGDEIGLLRLPQIELDRYRLTQGRTAPDWMERPHHLVQWSGSGRITARLGPTADVSLTVGLTRQEQRRSSLESQIGELAATFPDLVNGRFYVPDRNFDGWGTDTRETFIDEYFQRSTASAVTVTNGLAFTWSPRKWLSFSANGGLNLVSRDDESLLPPALRSDGDSVGRASRGTGRSLMSTANAQGTVHVPLGASLRLRTTVGANYTSTRTSDLVTQGYDLAGGTSSINGAGRLFSLERAAGTATFGWFVEPSLAYKQRLFLSTGLRFDGGNTYGSAVKLAGFPKVNASWLLSDEPFFPLKGLFGTVRLRAAYGQAGVQPGVDDRLRLYTRSSLWQNGSFGDEVVLGRLGNTQLRPERSTEVEGGIDVDLLDDRISVELAAYRKTRVDALMRLPVPPSVYGGGSVLTNVGTIRNTGVEVTLGLTPVRSRAVTWSSRVEFGRNRNTVVELGRGVEPFATGEVDWVKPGFPLFGNWVRPILGYDDVNGDGIIRADEVQVGDSLVFMGDALPTYQTSLHTDVVLLDGALAVSASFDYQDGLTQVMGVTNGAFMRGLNDPTAPLGEQAALAVSEQTPYGRTQTVSTFRFNTLSVRYRVPESVARALRARDLSIAVQGSNLGLKSSYQGKDPHVNAIPTGNSVRDAGGLPQPRNWSVRVDVGY